MSYRELWVLVKHLPPESWTQTALRDSDEFADIQAPEGAPKFGPWALTNHQLAALADEVAWLRYVVARTSGQANYPEPKPTPRPGLERPKRVQTEANVIYLNSLRARG